MKVCKKCGKENLGKHLLFCSSCRNATYFEKNAKNCLNCGKKYLANGAKKACSNKCNILSAIKINKNNCWEWQRSCDEFGYGHFRDFTTGKMSNAHRISYKTFKGLIPKGMFVCHSCDNPKCCNPEHLWLGSSKENMQDAKEKGRTLKGNRFRAKISVEDVINIRKEYGPDMGYKKLAKKYNVHWSNIRAIIKKRSWKEII